MTKKLPSVIFPILLILVVPLLAFWQATFGVYAMKWDIMDQFFPCRYFISECLKNGVMPYWCPYIHLGYPMYADPQAGLWYPISFLLAATVGYNVYAIQFEFALHLIIAAWGMYLLLRTLNIERGAALTVAALFPASGFFVSHASHLTWINSVAWLPWIFRAYQLGLRDGKAFRFVQTGLYLALCLTGGYLVYPVLASYGLLLVFVYWGWQNRRNRNELRLRFLYSLLVPLAFALLSSGYIASLLQTYPYLTRADGLNVETANFNPFSPASFLSFIFPFATCISTNFFHTDMTMRNLYMGLPAFPLLLIGLVNGNRKRNLWLLAVALFCLLAAMGEYTPVRSWLYHSLPFMKMFRHTAIFRAFSLFCFLIITANGFSVWAKENERKNRNIFLLGLGAISIALLGLLVFTLQKGTIPIWFPDFTSVESVQAFISAGNIYQSIIVQAVFQGLLLLLMFLTVVLGKEKKRAYLLSALWLVDIMLAAQLNAPGTVVSSIKATSFNNHFKELPKGFPNPGQTPLERYNQYGGDDLGPVVYNASMLRKQPCADGFNAFCLKNYMQFFDSPEYWPTLKQSVVYYSDKQGNAAIDSSYILLKEFSPNKMRVEASPLQSTYVTLLQSYFPGWEIWVDGKQTNPVISKHTFLTVPLAPGKHYVQFTYSPPYFWWFAFLQLISYLLLGVLAIRFYGLCKAKSIH